MKSRCKMARFYCPAMRWDAAGTVGWGGGDRVYF